MTALLMSIPLTSCCRLVRVAVAGAAAGAVAGVVAGVAAGVVEAVATAAVTSQTHLVIKPNDKWLNQTTEDQCKNSHTCTPIQRKPRTRSQNEPFLSRKTIVAA